MSPLPYIVVYTVRADALYVVRILHGRSSGRDRMKRNKRELSAAHAQEFRLCA